MLNEVLKVKKVYLLPYPLITPAWVFKFLTFFHFYLHVCTYIMSSWTEGYSITFALAVFPAGHRA